LLENGAMTSAPKQGLPSRHQVRICLFAIVVVAGLVRLWDLGGIPPGLFRDEAEKGYTALELWNTGRQGEFLEDGSIRPSRLLPIFVDAGGVKTSAIYQYLSAPIVGLFGLHVWTTRLVAALVGTLTVLVVFFLGRVLIGRDHGVVVALCAAAFVALSPTHVLFSRWAQQGITLPLLVALGVLCLLRIPAAREEHRRALSVGGGAFLALAAYAYDPARLVVPIIAMGVVWEFLSRRGNWRDLAPGAVVFIAVEIPLVLFTLTEGSARLERVGVFGAQESNSVALAVLNYLEHLNPAFLFIFGDANPRHSMPLSGLLPWAEVPFFLLGLVAIAWKRFAGARLLTVWLLAAPVAASLTADGIPHALRSILFFPAVHLVSAMGVMLLLEWWSRRWVLVAMGVSCAITAVLLLVALFAIVPRHGGPWQYGVLEALAEMDERNPGGPNVLSAQVPYAHYYVLFHDQPHPRDFQEHGLEAARTMILFPGMRLPEGALVARPPAGLFDRAQPGDIPNPDGMPGDLPAMAIRRGW